MVYLNILGVFTFSGFNRVKSKFDGAVLLLLFFFLIGPLVNYILSFFFWVSVFLGFKLVVVLCIGEMVVCSLVFSYSLLHYLYHVIVLEGDGICVCR